MYAGAAQRLHVTSSSCFGLSLSLSSSSARQAHRRPTFACLDEEEDRTDTGPTNEEDVPRLSRMEIETPG